MQLEGKRSEDTYVFLSMFKFEKRKGWDLLLEAYFSEFKAQDNVILYILTSAYHEEDEEKSPRRRIEQFRQSFADRTARPQEDLPQVILMDKHIPQTQLPSLYKAADCFVLPSRGEGWGRPHSEAMAMALPTIATNWSGNTQFMTEDNSFLIPIEGLESVGEGAFASHQWAKPSISKLGQIMRLVFTEREHAGNKGRLAREKMLEYSPDKVATLVVHQLESIARGLQGSE
jgi:glycosyltransferase involved in cell wall biosynthesis